MIMDQPFHHPDMSAFHDAGYSVHRGLLSNDEIASCRRALEKTIAERPDDRWERLVEPHVRDPFWLSLCTHPRVLAAVTSILGDDLILLMSHLIVKQPFDGLAVEWHQDRPYWPSVRGTDIVTVWLAIDDVDVENGCMQVIPRTHYGHMDLPTSTTDGTDLLGVRIDIDTATAAQAVPIELRAGDASIHDSYIIHGSAMNRSPRRRAGYTMRFGNARTTHVTIENHWVPVWLVHGHPPEWAGWKDARSHTVPAVDGVQ